MDMTKKRRKRTSGSKTPKRFFPTSLLSSSVHSGFGKQATAEPWGGTLRRLSCSTLLCSSEAHQSFKQCCGSWHLPPPSLLRLLPKVSRSFSVLRGQLSTAITRGKEESKRYYDAVDECDSTYIATLIGIALVLARGPEKDEGMQQQ